MTSPGSKHFVFEYHHRYSVPTLSNCRSPTLLVAALPRQMEKLPRLTLEYRHTQTQKVRSEDFMSIQVIFCSSGVLGCIASLFRILMHVKNSARITCPRFLQSKQLNSLI